MIVAQITDLHLDAAANGKREGVNAAAALEACVAHLNALRPRPDVVVATGDLVQNGDRGEYGWLAEILQPLKAPLYALPGNHDDRARVRAMLPAGVRAAEGEDWLQYAVEDWPVRLLVLDTLVPGLVHGALCAGRIAWLADRLAEEPQRPTMILMHHPPFATGMHSMDAMGLRAGGAALGEVVARYGNVERVLCGHVHRAIQVRWHGTIASIAPSPTFQMALNLEPGAEAAYVLEPPACSLHLCGESEAVVSHLSFIGDYGGPRPFHGGE